MTRLEELLRITSQGELHELYAFWDGDGSRPPAAGEIAAALAARMSDETLVRRRLRFLSRKLIDLLRFFLGRRQFEADVESVRSARSFGFMSPHEVEAAVRALVKRGFLFPRVTSDAEPPRYVVATELGHLLQRELEDLDLELSASFSLARMVAARGDALDAAGLAKLAAPAEVAQRIAALPEDVRDLLERALAPGGGVLPRALVARGTLDPGAAARRQLKEALEGARLGTVRHLALGEFGINHFDETLIVFEEVLDAELERRATAQPAPPARVRSLGVDLLSDLSLLLERLTREKVRFTQSGQVYRAAAKKIEDELILCAKGEFDAEKLFGWLLELAQQRHLVRRTPERTLQLSAKGKTWPRLSVQAQGGYNGNHLGDLSWTRLIGGSISFPVYSGGETAAKIEEARLNELSLQIQRREAELRVEEEVRRDLLAYRSAESRERLAEENARLALDELTLATDRFVNGVSSSIEVDNAQTSVASARDARVSALADREQARIELARATGEIREEIAKESP